MSFHSSQEQGEESLDQKYSDGKPSDMLSGTNTAKKLSRKGSKTGSSTQLPSLAISAHSSIKGTPQDIEEWLILSAEDSPASPSLSPESALEKLTNVICGQQQLGSFVQYDRVLRSWKTRQISLMTHTLERFSETWPKSGSMQNGMCFQPAKSGRHMHVKECFLLPTPVCSTGGYQRSPGSKTKRYRISGLATNGNLPNHPKGIFNPEYGEQVMGWPIGQTGLKPLETDKFRFAWLTPMRYYLAELLRENK